MQSNMNRRALMAGAAAVPVAALPALPALAAGGNTELIELVRRFDRLTELALPLYERIDAIDITPGTVFKTTPYPREAFVTDADRAMCKVPDCYPDSSRWNDWMVERVRQEQAALLSPEAVARLDHVAAALGEWDRELERKLAESGYTPLAEEMERIQSDIADLAANIMARPHYTMQGAAAKARVIAWEYDQPRDNLWREEADELDWDKMLLRQFLESVMGEPITQTADAADLSRWFLS